ncbi:MAG: hypothetical protein LBH66_09490 [Oscillospiraceae bacterium]|jgi:hypothetical protein|nr:hypothetical protein [Oscillospiraceae bacterium]
MKMKWTGVVALVGLLVVMAGMIVMIGDGRAEDEGQIVLNMVKGEGQDAEEVFPDLDKVVEAMEAIAGEDMDVNGNAYMENREVKPLPTDKWEIDEFGVTVRYPLDRLSTFSGRPGAYHFMWYELDGLFVPEAVGWVDVGSEGEGGDGLPGVAVRLGDEIERLSMMYGGGKESDYTVDKQAYKLEDARFRGVTVMTSRDDPTGKGMVTEIRAKRLEYQGVRVGVSDEETVIKAMGEPNERETIDADAAYYQLLPEGVVLWYDKEESRLGMLIDTDGILSVAILQSKEG